MKSFVFALMCSATVNVEASQLVRIATGEYPPYLSEDLQGQGLGATIISEAFAASGIDVMFGFLPWKRSYLTAKSGHWEATATWSYSEPRAKDFYYSDPLYQSEGVIFHATSLDFDWQSLDDLAGFRIGATNGYSYTPAFLNMAASGQLDVEFIESDQQNLKRLLNGSIHLFPINVDVGAYLLGEYFTPEETLRISYHSKPFSADSAHLLFSRKIERNVYYLSEFNKGLKSLKESGRIDGLFQAFREKHGIVNTPR